MPNSTLTLASARRRHINDHAAPELVEAVTITRFWRNVAIGPEGECWTWNGDTDRNGYGVFTYHGVRRPAHEMALSFASGEIRLEDLDTCHSCDNPACCNPDHLRFDTRQSNVTEMVNRGRGKNGGKLSPEEIVTIRRRRESGARQKDLARDYGVTDGQISMIVRGLRYPNIGGPIQTERRYCRG